MITLRDHIQELRAELNGTELTKAQRTKLAAEIETAVEELGWLQRCIETERSRAELMQHTQRIAADMHRTLPTPRERERQEAALRTALAQRDRIERSIEPLLAAHPDWG